MQLLDVLGRGGQGVVFRGTLHGLETAVKVLTDGPAQQPRGDKDRAAAGGGDGGGAESDGAPTTADAARRMRLVRGLRLADRMRLIGLVLQGARVPWRLVRWVALCSYRGWVRRAAQDCLE